MTIAGPLRWVGGKSRLRSTIVRLLPPHTRYCEAFAGGAWVFFGKERAPEEILNDVDGELINFYRIVRDRPEDFIQSFEWTLVARAEFEYLRDVDPATLDEVERARRLYYLVMAGWGGELGYPRFAVSLKDAGHGNRLIGALAHLRARIWPVHERLQGVTLENLDWRECLARHENPEAVFYLDPPFAGNLTNYRFNMRGQSDHEALAERLGQLLGRWVLSAYDTPETRALYHDRFIQPVSFASGLETGKGSGQRLMNREVLVANFWPKGATRGLDEYPAAGNPMAALPAGYG